MFFNVCPSQDIFKRKILVCLQNLQTLILVNTFLNFKLNLKNSPKTCPKPWGNFMSLGKFQSGEHFSARNSPEFRPDFEFLFFCIFFQLLKTARADQNWRARNLRTRIGAHEFYPQICISGFEKILKFFTGYVPPLLFFFTQSG